tara:strand:+ start:1668 stop:2414 length:747 start_codon:yes stop_codon:yes gene_type:complete
MIRLGSRGEEVKSFQSFLISLGFLSRGSDDGISGHNTVSSIRAYQRSSGLDDDGAAGPITMKSARADGWTFEGSPTSAQIEAANSLGIPVEVIQTIEAVESGGRPSAIRFEPHLFLRHKPSLVMDIPFTKGPKGFSVTRSETDQSAFEHAFDLAPEAAVKSTSWGLYQVLGSHLIKAYGTAESGVDSFYADPLEASYKLLVSWFKSNKPALIAAREKNWPDLVRRYNGPGNVGAYSAAMAREYAKVTA